jgi:hypothetical protein
MNQFEAKRAARAERLRERAEKKEAESAAAHANVDRIANVIPLGQPILVGHHSERRHRRDLARIDRGMRRSIEASKEAAELRRRADAADDNEAIFSDDPDAIAKLRVKLAEAEALSARLKADLASARRALKKIGGIGAQGWGDALIAAGVHEQIIRFAVHMGSLPTLANNSAGIRRLRERIAELEKKAASTPPEPEKYGDITIEESENRVRIYFPDKPSQEARTLLKSWGFRWSPSAGAWQRHANVQGWIAARMVAKKIAGVES